MGVTDSGIEGTRLFPETPWSTLCRIKAGQPVDHQPHLERLVALYWKPVYCVIRQFWVRTDQDAKDLTQTFFAEQILDGSLLRIPDERKGSFRALLKTAVGNFMRNDVRDAARVKRGGGARVVPVDEDTLDVAELVPDRPGLAPDEAFDLAWNHVVLTRAIEALEARLAAEGHAHHFEIFRRYDLDGERAQLSYDDLGRELGLSPAQVKRGLGQARATLRDLLVEQVRGYVDGPEALDAELRALLGR